MVSPWSASRPKLQRYESVSVEDPASGLFTNDISEAVLLQLKHSYESLSVVGLASGLFTNDISEAILLQLKHSYESLSLVGLATLVS